jgi:hypothetical protein
MKTTRVITITLSTDDLRDAVVSWAQSRKLMPPDAAAEVRLSVGTRTTGFGTNERDEPYGEVVLTVKT